MLKYILEVIKLNLARNFNLPIKPRFINFLLTYHCNSRCVMCNIWSLYAEKPGLAGEELTLKDIEGFIVNNKEELVELRNIGLTGGDPLLMRKDFVEVVKTIRKYLPRVHLGVQTNGLIPELARERLKEIISFCPDFSLAVSLDGIGQTHSLVRGVAGAFEKANLTIRYAKELGIKDITCGMTLNKHNYGQIKQLKDYSQKIGVEFSCFSAETSDYFNNSPGGPFLFTDKERDVIIGELRKYCGYHYFMDNLRLQLQAKRIRCLPCFSGFTSLVIDPFGNVKPCVLKVSGIEKDIFGNIKDKTLKEMLNSADAGKIKEKIKKCSCWCQCEVSSSALVAPLDVVRWLIFRCPDKRGFLSHILRKKKKLASFL